MTNLSEIILGIILVILGILWHKYAYVAKSGYMKDDRNLRKHMVTFFLILLGVLNILGKTSILFGLGIIR